MRFSRIDDVEIDVDPDGLSARERDQSLGAGMLLVEGDARQARALKIAHLAEIEGAPPDERDPLLGDLPRARPQERRDRAAADVREDHAAHVVRRRRRERVEVAVRIEIQQVQLRLRGERS